MPSSPNSRGRSSAGSKPSAAEWNKMRDSAGPISAEPPLFATATPSGTRLHAELPRIIRARVVSFAAGVYSMHQIDRGPTGTWFDLPFTFSAKEYNGFTTVAVTTRVDAEYFPSSNEWLFRGSSC